MFERHKKRDRLTAAKRLLDRRTTVKLLGAARYDKLRAQLARRWFQLGDHAKAYDLAAPAAKR